MMLILRAFLAGAVFGAVFFSPAGATWKPEYDKAPDAVKNWFQSAQVPGGCSDNTPSPAWHRLGICGCCQQSERLMTKFVANKDGEWSYYPDPNCTTKGCKLLPIPNDVTHDDEIHAESPKDDELPEFEAMRREGVLFIYDHQPSCFWPPERSDN